jgi:hypothetical protein
MTVVFPGLEKRRPLRECIIGGMKNYRSSVGMTK